MCDRLASAQHKLEKFSAVVSQHVTVEAVHCSIDDIVDMANIVLDCITLGLFHMASVVQPTAGVKSEKAHQEQLAALASSVFAGLRSAHVVLGTAQGQALAGGATRELFADAMRKRELFSDSQASTLEGWVLTTKALRPETPAAAKAETAAAALICDRLDASAMVAAAAASRAEASGNGAAEEASMLDSAPPPPPSLPEAVPAANQSASCQITPPAAAAAAAPEVLLTGYDPFGDPHGSTELAESAAAPLVESSRSSQPPVPQIASIGGATAVSATAANGGAAQSATTSALSSAILGDVNSLLQ